MARYDLSCNSCSIIYEDVEHSVKEDHPNCPKCNGKLEVYFDPGHIPGVKIDTSNVRKNLPGELQKYYKKKADDDRYMESEMSKDITFPDGTHHKGTKNFTREKVIDQSIFKKEFRN